MEHIVIIGNGVSGVTAARHIRKQSDNKITIISSETKYFFSRTALMYIYMGHMKLEHTQPYENNFWKKNNIDLLQTHVEKIDFDNKVLNCSDNQTLKYDKLILAVGSKFNKFGWPGQDLDGVGGMYSYQDLERIQKYSKDLKHAVIVGGGLIGVELAEMFHSRKIPVTFLVREDLFWGGVLPKEEAELVGREIIKNNIDLKFNTELKEILPDENGRVKSVILSTDEELSCQFVGLTAGVTPNIDFLKDTKLELGRGIKVNEYFETNVKDVYAIGDCAEFIPIAIGTALPNRKPLEQVWYTGKIQGETLAYNICGTKKAYNPGTWFNSAKFFDIEYQTYGWVWNQLKEGEATFYWEHPKGNKCLRINYDKATNKVLGFNVFGIRLKHEICVAWIDAGKRIDYVMEHLAEANFDPEFFTRYENDILSQFYKNADATILTN